MDSRLSYKIEDFLNDNANITLINDSNFLDLFNKAQALQIPGSYINEILVKAGLNPLNNLLEIPGKYMEDTSIDHLFIPNKVRYIGPLAFSKGKFVDIRFEEDSQLQYIENYAFSSCNNIRTVHFDDNLLGLYRGVFARCVHLNSVYFGKGSLYIGRDVFDGCDNLKDIYVQNTINSCERLFRSGTMFTGKSHKVTIHCSDGDFEV